MFNPGNTKIKILVMGDGDRLPIPHWCRKAATELSEYYLPTVVDQGKVCPTTRIIIEHSTTRAVSIGELETYSLVIYIPKPRGGDGESPDSDWLMRHSYVVATQAMVDNLYLINPKDTTNVHLLIADCIANNGLKNHIKKEESRNGKRKAG